MFKFLRDKLYYQPLIGSKSYRDRVLSNDLLSSSLLHFLFVIALLANFFGVLFPVLGSNDSNFYAVVAKHIAQSNDWINLTYASHDWLDKPHFPFWMTAISFKIFGINAFAYIFPGFLFHLVGARYTYLLTKHFYSHQVGLVASIIYLTTLHLMLSSSDVRAEAYLLGEIIPACYYWLLYYEDSNSSVGLLVKGAIFTALAVMTKGIFVVATISSGLFCLWVYKREWSNFTDKKWLFAIALSLFFITPELLALLLQFDLHPEKVVFGHTGVSGIKFFFWDSQFGRFFDNGPITSGHSANFGHYFYFIHTFLWAFLPWTMIFMVALWNIYKDMNLSVDVPKVSEQKNQYVFLLGAFFPTFLLFSATEFQLDHYTNILMPFATIICANWICNKATRFVTHPVFYFQTIASYILCILVTVLALLIFNGTLFATMISLCVVCIALFGIFNNNRYLNKSIVYPVLSISLVFVFSMLVNGRLYPRYDAGYKIGEFLNTQTPATIVDYQINYSSLEFHNDNAYVRIESLADLEKVPKPYYLVLDAKQWSDIKSNFTNSNVLGSYMWIRQEKFIPTLFNLNKRLNDTQDLMVVFVQDDLHETKELPKRDRRKKMNADEEDERG